MTGGALLRLAGVRVAAGGRDVLAGVDLAVSPGEAVAVLGANGAGKTTLLDVVSGLVAPAAGRVELHGRDITRTPAHRRARLGIARAFQDSRLYGSMTVAEAIAVASRAASPAATEVAGAMRGFGLEAHETAFVSELSTGTRRLVELAAAAAGHAELLLLDEPTTGVAHGEKQALLELLCSWRRRTGGAVLLVEHDAEFAAAAADRVVALEGGRVVAGGPVPVSGAALPGTAPEAGGRAQTIRAAIEVIEAAAGRAPAPPIHEHLSKWTLARLGLRELAAGILSVLTLGVLNRVMKVEMGVPLWITASILAAYNLAAPLAILVGHVSDRRPFRGRHRTPYIVGGAALTAVCAAAAPAMAQLVARDPGSLASIVPAVALFTAMGLGMFGSGAAYFALLADITTEEGRGRAVSIVYSMLMVGILVGVGLSVAVLGRYDFARLEFLFVLVAVLVVLLTVASVWRVEPARRDVAPVQTPLRDMLRHLAGAPQTRRFFAFMGVAIFFAFLQQAVLEPFGGDVFGLSVRATTGFNAIQITGVLAGMALAGTRLSGRYGNRRTAGIGIVATSAAFGVLAVASAAQSQVLVYPAILAMGAGLGVLNVGALALMMDMTAVGAAGLSMGIWTLAHSVADGLATAGGGVAHQAFVVLLDSEPLAYAGVFSLEAAGLLGALVLLRRISASRFREEVVTTGAS